MTTSHMKRLVMQNAAEAVGWQSTTKCEREMPEGNSSAVSQVAAPSVFDDYNGKVKQVIKNKWLDGI